MLHPEEMGVEHIMRTNIQFIPASATFDEVLHFIERSTYNHFAVVEEGVVEAGDAIEFVSRVEGGTPLFELARLHAYDRADWDAMERVVDDGFVPERWRERFREALEGRGD